MPLPSVIRRRHLLLAAVASAGAARAQEAPLHVLVDGSIEMPQALFKDGQAVDGLQVELAREIGRRLGRPAVFHLVPRRRVAPLLIDGQDAELICNYLPQWLPGNLQWSRPFFENADLLVTAARHPAPARLADVAGHPIGTVSGYLYPEVAATLGTAFVRDDAPNAIASLRKLALGRVEHALIGRVTFEYMARRGDVPIELHPPLVIARFKTSCALSPRSSVKLAQLDAAIAAMQADGTLARILDRYR